jgi:zinc transport system substrate-binding protein
MDRAVGAVAALVMLLSVGCASGADAPAANDSLLVYTSFYPMYDFTKKIGGDKIEPFNMVPAGADPHDWEPTPAMIAGLNRADVFIYNGAGMEHWADAVLASLQNPNLVAVETSAGLPLLKGSCTHAINHMPGRGCDGTDSHVWLDPQLAKLQMEAIKNAFIAVDPGNRGYYEANFEFYAAELDKLDTEFREALAPLTNRVIVVAHEAFGYLCEAYGLTQMGIMTEPDAEPTAARMAEVIAFVNRYNVGTIFFEELASARVGEVIADATGARVAVLNPLEGLTDTERAQGADYFSVMRGNLEALREALE